MATTAKQAAEEKRREKARNLRYKKPMLKDLNLESIRWQVNEMYSACGDVAYFIEEGDNDVLMSTLDGDADDAEAFRMQFMVLQSELEMLQDDLYETFNYTLEEDDFDLFFAAIGPRNAGDEMYGYDEFEGDYYGLESTYEAQAAEGVATEKLKRLTKADIIERAQLCFKIAFSFLALRNRYQDLEAALDILRAENVGLTAQIKAIETAYERAEAASFAEWKDHDACREYERLISQLPDRIWIE